MAKTMIHFEPCKIDSSQAHNMRHKDLDYIRKDLSSSNKSLFNKNLPRNLRYFVTSLKEIVKQKTHRKMQEKAQPLKEGVLLISENTSNKDVVRVMQSIEQITGWIPMQAHIHRDEGHYGEDGRWIPNLHAHLVFCTVDLEAGKRIKKKTYKDSNGNLYFDGRRQMSDVQTAVADILGMERGGRKSIRHLNAIEFKVKEKEKELALLEKEIGKRNSLKDLFDPEIAPAAKYELLCALLKLSKQVFIKKLSLPKEFEISHIELNEKKAKGSGRFCGQHISWTLDRDGDFRWSDCVDGNGQMINPHHITVEAEPAFTAAFGVPELQESLRDAILALSTKRRKDPRKGQHF